MSSINLIKKIAVGLLLVLILIPTGAYIALQDPIVQTKVAKRVINHYTKGLNSNITIGKVCYLFFNKIIINDVLVTYNNNRDTLLSSDKLSVSFSAKELFRNRLKIKKVSLYDGNFNLVTYKDRSTNIDHCFNLARTVTKDTTKLFSTKLNVKEVRVRDVKFTYIDSSSNAPDYGEEYVCFRDLSCDISEMSVRNIISKDNMFQGDLVNLAFVEKSGFKVDKLNGRVKVGRRLTYIEDLYFFDGNTELKANYLSLRYNGIGSFKNFVDSVRMETTLDNAFISFTTLSKLAPALKNNKLAFYATGKISGPVSSLTTDSLKITSESGLTQVDLNARLSGLPKSMETMVFLDVNDASTTASDLSKVISSLNDSKPDKYIANLSPLVKYRFKGRLAGLFTDFVANGTITSNIGNVYMDMLLRQNPGERGLDFQGKLQAQEFNIGTFIRNKSLGKATFRSTLSGLIRDEELGGSKFYIDSISIKKLEFNKYPYSNIYSVGSYVDKRFDGRVICHDPNLDFIFQGIFGRSAKRDSYYDFFADVAYADLAALKLDKRDSISVVSFKTTANYTQKLDGEILGKISVRSMEYKNRNGEFNIGDISIQSLTNQDKFNISLRSGFANATYSGSDFITGFVEKVIRTSVYRHIPSLLSKREWSPDVDKNKHYKLDVRILDTKAISELLLPGLKIADRTSLNASIDENDNLNVTLSSGEIGYKGYNISNLFMKMDSGKEKIETDIRSTGINISNIILDSNKVVLSASNDTINIRTAFSNDSDIKNRILLSTKTNVRRDSLLNIPILDICLNPSRMIFNNQLWTLSKSKVTVNGKNIDIEGFRLENNNQHIAVDGSISPLEKSSLDLQVNNLDISAFNAFMKKPMDFAGIFSGNATLVDLYNNPQIIMNLKGERAAVAKSEIGTLIVSSTWDNNNKKFDLLVYNELDGHRSMQVNGTYTPKGKYLDVEGNFSNLKPGYASPFFTGIVSNLTGGIYGRMYCKGPIDKLVLSSDDAYVKDLSFTVDFTKVRYTVNGKTKLHDKGLTLADAVISDQYGATGHVTGGLTYKHFRNLGFNALINFNNMEVIDLTENDNSTFYGKAFGSGLFSLNGDLRKITMDISASSNRNTEIHIPLASTSEAVNSNLLSFVQNSTFTADKITIRKEGEKKKAPSTEMSVQLKINITPEAAMYIEIDKSVGDVIKGYGSGLISMDIRPAKDIFNIQGDYLIDRGSYKFVLQGLFNRDFTIQQGGSIGFNGDIARTTLNLTANYRTKTAINTLISDTSSVSSRRTVDCLIKMTGPLMNPNLTFGIEIPDLDPLTKSRVDAALNTEDKTIKQVMSILVSNSFIPDIQSSIVNNSTLLYSNATEVLSNQINKIFNQLDIPVDLSFNYQPGQNGRDVFDAAVSAQLFNNRVIINGNIGNARYTNSTSDVVGDFDAEIKLDDKGRFRLKLFSHSADQFSNYLDNSQRNGGGLVYQEEFTTFRELINSIFGSRKKKKTPKE